MYKSNLNELKFDCKAKRRRRRQSQTEQQQQQRQMPQQLPQNEQLNENNLNIENKNKNEKCNNCKNNNYYDKNNNNNKSNWNEKLSQGNSSNSSSHSNCAHTKWLQLWCRRLRRNSQQTTTFSSKPIITTTTTSIAILSRLFQKHSTLETSLAMMTTTATSATKTTTKTATSLLNCAPSSIIKSKFNKSNKLLITIIMLFLLFCCCCMPLLITTTTALTTTTIMKTTMTATICQSNQVDTTKTTTTKIATTTLALATQFVALTFFIKNLKTASKSLSSSSLTTVAKIVVLVTLSATLIGADTTNEYQQLQQQQLQRQQQRQQQQQLQPQRQLFAMLTKNGQQQSAVGSMGGDVGVAGSGGGGGGDAVVGGFLRNALPRRRNKNRSSSNSNYDDESTSLETIGFVSDDGDQRYEKAEKALAAAAAAAASAASGNRSQSQNQLNSNNNNNNNNVNCPKECKCLNDFFDCHKQHLDRVPTLPNYVQNLDLSFNNLNDSTITQIRNLSELKRLHLKRNQLDVMPKFEGLINLKQLNLANNRIQQISSDALIALPKLKSLDLSRNFLHSLEANYFPETNRLAHLILNFNKISSIDEHSFEHLTGLLDLNLNSNKLTTLPAGVFKSLNKLEKLSLNNNQQLEINWSTFKGLLSLKKLSLQSNNIRALQDGVFHVMRGIETIELDDNDITSLSRQGLFNLTKLHHLSLSNNSISRIELDTWEFTQSLVHLDLSFNNISEFKPQHLDCLQHLRVLNLGHNKIDFFADNTFDCVKNLEELYLKRNKLAWIIEDAGAMPPFKSLRKLRKLDLSGNNLKQINSKSLLGLANLEELYLENNALASIQNNAFEHMTHLKKVKLKSMNFICDCDLRWFQRWLLIKSHGSPKMQENAICGYPDHLFDQKLLTLTQNELICADSPKPVIQTEPKNQLAVKGANLTMECIANSPAAAALAASDELKIKWRHDNQNLRERNNGGHTGSSSSSSSSSSSNGGSSTPAGPPQLQISHNQQHHHHGHHANSYSYSTTETQIHHDAATNQTTIVGYLRLFNVSYETAGRYQCVVTNAFGTTYSQKFKLSIGIHPSFLQIPSNLTIDSGDTARLVCSATGDPMPEIALQKFGASDFPAATERRLQVIREENAFIITNAKPIDTGIYTCTAESAAGEIKVNASLVVNDKPQPNIPIVRKEIVLGTSSVIECLSEMVADMQHPHREWFKDNKPFHTSTTSASERYYFTVEKEVLVIVNTQSMDAGNYRCEITDDSKTYALQTELIVVQEDFSRIVIMIGAGAFIAFILITALIVWIVLSYQRRKMYLSAGRNAARVAAASSHRTLSGSRGSALDQTQLTTLNRTYLLAAQNTNEIASNALRPHSLVAELEMNGGLLQHNDAIIDDAEQQRNCLIVASTPSYEQQMQHTQQQPSLRPYDGTVDAYLRRNSLYDAEHQQDHLSSKDSGTGSDAAVKRSLEDFTTALLPLSAASIDMTTQQTTIVPTHGRGGSRSASSTGAQQAAYLRPTYNDAANEYDEREHEHEAVTPTRATIDSDPESVTTSPVLGISDAVEMHEFRRNGAGQNCGGGGSSRNSAGTPNSSNSSSSHFNRYANNSGNQTPTTPTTRVAISAINGFDGVGVASGISPMLKAPHTKCKQDLSTGFSSNTVTTQAVDI